MEYCEKTIEGRCEESEFLLPPLIDPEMNTEKKNLNLPHLMLDKVSLLFINIFSFNI